MYWKKSSVTNQTDLTQEKITDWFTQSHPHVRKKGKAPSCALCEEQTIFKTLFTKNLSPSSQVSFILLHIQNYSKVIN